MIFVFYIYSRALNVLEVSFEKLVIGYLMYDKGFLLDLSWIILTILFMGSRILIAAA